MAGRIGLRVAKLFSGLTAGCQSGAEVTAVQTLRAVGKSPGLIQLSTLNRFPTLNVSSSAATRIFSESAVGLAARATAWAVSSSGKTCEINGRTSSRREKTRRATSACNVKSEE